MAKNNKDLAPSKKEKVTVGQFILAFILLLCTLFAFLPVELTFVAAFTDEKSITQNGFRFWPKDWSLAGFSTVLRYGSQLAQSYGITIFVTVVGTLLGLLFMSMFAYSISRKEFMLGKYLSIFLLIPMLFNGGTLSGYIVFTSYYHLKDSLLLLILPLCVSTMNVIILRTYIVNSIPSELMEAAKIDGAGEYRTFFQITLPLLKPSLAAVGFMMATAYWNDWQNALLYIDSDAKKPLQLLLINIQKSIEFLLNNSNVPASARAAMGGTIPQYSATMAKYL
ncbi:carbohydrate ABC transporter permease [Butyrivibrio sp. NC3005]|uniref:carbohydrate ABC transporter permease n=1 Tax=Butyrivibrio sp. NC3005 TaxID=1280685 RepID=UPI0004214D13|nr:carbohydrate ABC transporter permease [Butyrivibrio sp. NC3005]